MTLRKILCSRCRQVEVETTSRRGLAYCTACRAEAHEEAWRKHARERAERRAEERASRGLRRGQHENASRLRYILDYDPCDAPMARGTAISTVEFRYGVELGAFEPGTIFIDRLNPRKKITV